MKLRYQIESKQPLFFVPTRYNPIHIHSETNDSTFLLLRLRLLDQWVQGTMVMEPGF